MSDQRQEMDERVSRTNADGRIASDLGLRGKGHHFYCPGRQPLENGEPELMIKDGQFFCFRCETQGDVVGLVKLSRRCDLDEALDWISREIQKRTESPEGG